MIFALRILNRIKKIHIKPEIFFRQHIQTMYEWQGNSRRENYVELIGMSKSTIWISDEKRNCTGVQDSGIRQIQVTGNVWRKKISDSPNSACSRRKMVVLSEELDIQRISTGMFVPPKRTRTQTAEEEVAFKEDDRQLCNHLRQYRIFFSLRRNVSFISSDSFLGVLFFIWKGIKVYKERIRRSGEKNSYKLWKHI